MPQILVSIFACLIILLNLLTAAPVQAATLLQTPPPDLSESLSESTAVKPPDLAKQLEDEILQLETLLTPTQRNQFETAIADGKSFRKAFKAVTLTPDQKSQLAALFKTFPKKDSFATLTSDQKKEFFLKKKEIFAPTSEEISDKITAGMKKKELYAPTAEDISARISAGMKERGLAPDDIKEKINAGFKNKETFMPDLQAITEKISQKLAAIKQSIQAGID